MNNSGNTNQDGDFLGLDIGEKRIGVARANTLVKIAEPLEVIEVEKTDIFSYLKDLIENYQALGVVVGLPRGLNGQETDQTRYCKEVAVKLSEKTKLPVYMIDEAGSTKVGEERKNAYPGASLDSLAATVFLEDFIKTKDKESLRVQNG